jgi:hypothetical protein
MSNYLSAASNYLSYGSQEQRSLFPFNKESIKHCFIKLGENHIPGTKIWVTVEVNDEGQLECVLIPSTSCNLTRQINDQSALELKCRDIEFIPLFKEIFNECSKDEKEKIRLGIGYQEVLYREEKKFRHAKFFNNLIKNTATSKS